MQTFLFYVSKILRPIFASPYFLSLLAVLVVLILLPAQTWKKRAVKAGGIAVLLALGALSTPVLVRALARSWETPLGSSTTLAVTGSYDAVVVLGGSIDGINSTGEQLMLNDAAERLTAAVMFYQKKIVPRIIFTGGSGHIQEAPKEAPIAGTLLEVMGIPKEAILLETESRNTFENAQLTKKLMEEAGIRRVVLVTSAWHMKRAAAIFRKAGIEFTPYAVDTVLEYYGVPGDYLPDARALDIATRLFRERIGYAAYHLLGRL